MSVRHLIIFDVDGTLVDSQGDIVAAMNHAFERAGLRMPDRDAILGIVGLSLDVAIPRLAPDLPAATHMQLVDWYKDAYIHMRARSGAAHSSPLYPHVRATLEKLHQIPDTLLGVATGKSRRGLDKLLKAHDLRHFFTTQQVSDDHPSKPDPAMLQAALGETGCNAHDAVMIGDTSFDMDMAQAAGICGIGVSWGYHPRAALTAAHQIIDDIRALPECIASVLEAAG